MSQGKEDVSPPRTQTDDDSEHAVEGCATSTDANEDEGIVLNTDADFSMRSFRASTSDNAEAAEPEEDEQETPAADDSGSDESAVPPSKHSFLASVTYSPESISPHLTQVQEEKSEQQEDHPEECISEHADLSVSLASEAERLMQLNQANSSASTPLLHPSTTLRQLFAAAAAASAPPTGNSTAPAKRRRMPGRNSFTSSKLEEIRERFHPRGANQPAIPPSQDVIFDSETHTVPEIAAVVEWLTAVNNGVGVTAKTPEDVFGSVGSEITGSDSFVEMVGKMLAVSAGQQHGAENVGAGNSAEANFWLNAMTLLNNSGGDAPNPTDVGQMYSAIVETMTKGFEEAKCQKPAEQSLPLPNYVADARLNEQQLMLNEAFAQLIRSSGDTSMLPGIAQPTRMNTKLQPEPLNGGLDMILSAMTSGSSVDELAALMSAFAGTAGGDAAKEENSVNNLHSSHKFNVQKRASLNRSAAPIHSVSTCKIYGQQQVHSATHSVTNNKCGGGDTVPTSATPKFSTTTTADLCCSSTASTSSSALASPLSTASSNQTASSTSSASLVGQSIPEWLNEKALTDFLTQSVVANGAAEDQTLGLLNSVLRSSGTNNLGDFAGALNALINQVAATNETPKTVASVVTPNKSKLSASQPTSKSAATTTAVTAANNTRRSTLSSTPVSSGGGPLPVWLRPANNENTNNNTTKDQRQHQQPDALARTTVASKSNSITPPTGAPPTVASVLEERRRKRPRITSKSSASATAGGLFNNNLNGGSAATAATSLTTSTTTTSPVLKQVLAGVTGTNCTVSATVNSLMAAAAAAGSDASNEAAAAAASLVNSREFMELSELEEFANSFKKQRIKHGFTQGDVGLALGKRYGTDFSQTTISRFEALNLSYKNMCKLRPLLKEWLEEAEQMIENGATVVDILEAPSPQLIENQNDWNGGEHSDDRTSANGGGSSDGNSVGGGNGKMPLNPLTTPRLIGNSIIPPLKRRRKRTNLDNAQKASLDVYFRTNCRPDHQRMNEIAAALELDPDVVRVWFCNRRQKLRKVC